MQSRLVLVDSDDYTASILADDLARRGIAGIIRAHNPLDLPDLLGQSDPEAVIFNYHSDRPESLAACSTIKMLAPKAAIVAIASPGPAMKALRAWSRQTGCIDVIVEKPLSDERFFLVLDDLLKARVAARRIESRASRLERLVPAPALTAIEQEDAHEAELFEAAVLFTDIRGSSQLIREQPVREFFRNLNEVLSAQAAEIGRHEGAVVKYTGDGLLAVFRGMGRSYLALRCALDLVQDHGGYPLPFGVGVAEGLVMAGLIGDSRRSGQRQQYDVIGATVHLAARLCSMAAAGEVIATRSVNGVARLQSPPVRDIGKVSLRGFSAGVDCVAFQPARST